MQLPAKVARSIRTRGVPGTVRHGLACLSTSIHWWLDSWYDWRHNVDTSGKIPIGELDVGSKNAAAATWYEPVPNSCLRQLLGRLEIEFERFVFLDFGSGKGRALFLAAEHPFKRVIGVEFSPALHRVAQRNITTYRSRRRRCHDIQVVLADVTEYELPAEPTVLFMYSPFNAATLGRVVRRLNDSLARHPREFYLLFVGVVPELIQTLLASGLHCREIPLRHDYIRGETKRGFILHHPAPASTPEPRQPAAERTGAGCKAGPC